MDSQQTSVQTENARKMVLAFVDAINREDFDKARSLADSDMQFKGVLGERSGAENYIADMRKMKFRYDIIKAIADVDDVCLFYNLDMGGVNVFCCGWYHLENGRIKELRVIFDPRPVLEKK